MYEISQVTKGVTAMSDIKSMFTLLLRMFNIIGRLNVMSRGLEAVYKLLNIENGKAIYAYSGDNFNYSYDKELARLYDGRIEIMLSAFEDVDAGDLFKSEKIKITKYCYYAEKNSFGMDILAMKTISNILMKYKETLEIPKKGHWIV